MLDAIRSNFVRNHDQDRVFVVNKDFIEPSSPKGIHYYKFELWGKILALFNRAVKLTYFDEQYQDHVDVYISTISLENFKKRCVPYMALPYNKGLKLDQVIYAVILQKYANDHRSNSSATTKE